MKGARRRYDFLPVVRTSKAWIIPALLLSASIAAADTLPPSNSGERRMAGLADLTLEQLGSIVVTLVSRRDEPLSDAAASIYVISAEDIRRMGLTSLPEALRLAPNLQVARADANQYAISARGFNSVTANKMLVMIDGRTVYSPLFSGVFWEAQDVMLDDIDRIEVVSGPGGTLWGVNAVNGVIHIITRSGEQTHGGLVSGGAGDEDRVGAARYGGAAGGAHYRVYGMWREREHTERADGLAIPDASDRVQVGFRADWAGAATGLTVQGDAYRSDIDQAVDEREISGANVLARWDWKSAGGQLLRVQAYFDHTERKQPGAIHESLNTYDIELQHDFRPFARHDIVWGGGYRYQPDRVANVNPAALAFLPPNRDLSVANVFAQDDVALVRNLTLTLGAKIEYNDYTEFEFLPNARAAWKPAEGRLLWAAASRAVRAPSRLDRELYIPGMPPFFVLAGGPDFVSEVSNVFELGYRDQPATALSYSATAFYHDHDRLRSLEPSPEGPVLENGIQGHTAGVEAWGSYRVARPWRLSAGFVYQDIDLEVKPGSQNLIGTSQLGNDPDHWWMVRSSLDLGSRFELDAMIRYVGELPAPRVPSYTALDACLGWHVDTRAELWVRGQNLLQSSHPEWGASPTRAEHDPAVFGAVRIRI